MGSDALHTERPRDIFSAACADIARSFLPLGFRYLRSKPRIVRQDGDLRDEILFSSCSRNYLISPDQRNIAAEALLSYRDRHELKFTAEDMEEMLRGSIVLNLTACVRSAKLQQWRRTQAGPLRTDDYIAGNEIGLLRSPPSLATFNLAPKPTRQQSIVEAAALVHEVALPFFDLFRKPDELIGRLLKKDLPGFWEALTFEYILCFGGRQLALELLRRRLGEDNELRARFDELLPRFKAEDWHESTARERAAGIPLGGHQERAGRLAIAAATYQLGLDD